MSDSSECGRGAVVPCESRKKSFSLLQLRREGQRGFRASGGSRQHLDSRSRTQTSECLRRSAGKRGEAIGGGTTEGFEARGESQRAGSNQSAPDVSTARGFIARGRLEQG